MKSLLTDQQNNIAQAIKYRDINRVSDPVLRQLTKNVVSDFHHDNSYLHQMLVTYCDSDYQATETVETNASDRHC